MKHIGRPWLKRTGCYTLAAMRRWLLIFLVVFLPMQLSWAAVANYCQHETGAAAQHFGHHEHQHKVDAKRTDTGNPKAAGAIDADCGMCHASSATAIFETVSFSLLAVSLDTDCAFSLIFSSRPPTLPERPNWADLA